MPSPAPPPDEPDDTKAGVTPSPEPTPESDPLKALPASALIGALAGRIAVSARRVFGGMRVAAPRWRARFRAWRVPVALSSVRPRRGLVIALGLASIPAVYVAYCVATIPFAGAASVQAAPSAIIFEGEDGRPFATRGILKGQGIAADQIPPLLGQSRGRDRRSAILRSRRHRHPVDHARRLARCDRPQSARRQHHHAAIGPPALSHAGAYLETQGAGGGACRMAGASPVQKPNSRALSQYRLFRRRCLRRQLGGTAVLRQERPRAVAERSGDACRSHQSAIGARSGPQP